MRLPLLASMTILLCCGVPPSVGAAPQQGNMQISLTFEYLPFMKPMGYWRPREISNLILRRLAKESIPAAGFFVQEKMEDDPSTYVILDDWSSRKQTVGNQTWGNADLNLIEAKHFIEHVADGQKYLRNISKAYPQNYRFLRYPNLHQGETIKKKTRVERTMDRARYQIAHVSIKTATNFFNRPFVRAFEGPPEELESLKKRFLKHVLDSLDYSETQSQLVFGRNIPHILQLHTGVAVSTMLGPIIEALQERGYQFIPLQDALEDPAYKTEETYVGPMGLTFIDRVAATRGIPFQDESGVDQKTVEKELDALFP